jgi:hypothetical protein
MQKRQHRGRGRSGARSPVSSTNASSKSGGVSKHRHDRETPHSQQRRAHQYHGPAGEPAGASRHILPTPQGAGSAFRGHGRGHGGREWGHMGQPNRFLICAAMPFASFQLIRMCTFLQLMVMVAERSCLVVHTVSAALAISTVHPGSCARNVLNRLGHTVCWVLILVQVLRLRCCVSRAP